MIEFAICVRTEQNTYVCGALKIDHMIKKIRFGFTKKKVKFMRMQQNITELLPVLPYCFLYFFRMSFNFPK